ncbi:Sec-independent protein translocase protein TatB [Pseudidiomarina piscicola]|uniref:Sec-independent protein translocase protein TatB n=1 Tax=Pseudidiomarina piscicola TaxID=2614830 RepID=A0A6S6WML0_9GAMM|nr:Sec-independent protein translocase protein TatB [Pseudidiomarina piscicola]CAB0151308.1 Sec-independent protein translocase protein TatB [Pseudidiomarina piscicola]VZT40789.1 Sec-independent protein translocase protein TatB [Pseudomonas aeruginosa]
MFDIGFWELLFVALIGLLVLGPERLPVALRGFQRGVQKMKSFGTSVQAELNHELRIKELHEHLSKAEKMDIEQLSPELQRSMAELREAAAGVQRPYAKKNSVEPKDDADDSSSAAENDKSKPSS